MKLRKLMTIITLASLVLSSCSPKAPKHSAEAEALLTRLGKIAATGHHMVAHQDDLVYGTYWNVNNDGTQDFKRSDVLSCAGDYPAVVGFELGEIELGGEYSLDSVRFDYIREASLAHYNRGGIITYSWHCRNPLTGESAWDVSSDQVVKSILPGGSEHEKFMGWMDTLCEWLLTLRTEDGALMPVIWRPWHEHTGGWFWWGVDGLCTYEDYIALWKMTYDYMVGEKGLDNLIWTTSPDVRDTLPVEMVEASYPGDAYVDILGIDCYWWGGEDVKAQTQNYIYKMTSSLEKLTALGKRHNKLIAVTETGAEGIKDHEFWTEGLAASMEGFNAIYALTWRNASDPAHAGHYFCTYPGEASEADFKAYTEREDVLLLGDIQEF